MPSLQLLPSHSHSRISSKNTREIDYCASCTVKESIDRFEKVTKKALDHGIKVRGYVSTVVGCPYEGFIQPEKVEQVSKRLIDLGCYEISLGDTIGVGILHLF